MRAFLRREFNALGFFLGLGLITAGIALWCVPAALVAAGAGLCVLFGLRASKAAR